MRPQGAPSILPALRVAGCTCLLVLIGACDNREKGGVQAPSQLYTCRDRPGDLAQPPESIPPLVDEDGQPIALPPYGDEDLERPCPEGQIPVPEPIKAPKGNPAAAVGFGQMATPDSSGKQGSRTGRLTRGVARSVLQYYPGYKYATMSLATPLTISAAPVPQATTLAGAGYVVLVEKPTVNDDGHSLSEVAVVRNPYTSSMDAVEIGWGVAPSYVKEAAQPQYINDPHLFVYHWIRSSQTCYNDCSWNQYSSTVYPGKKLKPGKMVYVGWMLDNGGRHWWVWWGTQWVGYFSAALWRPNDLDHGTGVPMWYGEVYEDAAPYNGMGSGVQFSNDKSSWMKEPCVIANSNAPCQVVEPTFKPFDWPYTIEPNPPATPDTHHYGGPNP